MVSHWKRFCSLHGRRLLLVALAFLLATVEGLLAPLWLASRCRLPRAALARHCGFDFIFLLKSSFFNVQTLEQLR